jgi:hypothetical protein
VLVKKPGERRSIAAIGQPTRAFVARRAIKREHLGRRFALVDTGLSLGQHRQKPGK